MRIKNHVPEYYIKFEACVGDLPLTSRDQNLLFSALNTRQPDSDSAPEPNPDEGCAIPVSSSARLCLNTPSSVVINLGSRLARVHGTPGGALSSPCGWAINTLVDLNKLAVESPSFVSGGPHYQVLSFASILAAVPPSRMIQARQLPTQQNVGLERLPPALPQRHWIAADCLAYPSSRLRRLGRQLSCRPWRSAGSESRGTLEVRQTRHCEYSHGPGHVIAWRPLQCSPGIAALPDLYWHSPRAAPPSLRNGRAQCAAQNSMRLVCQERLRSLGQLKARQTAAMGLLTTRGLWPHPSRPPPLPPGASGPVT